MTRRLQVVGQRAQASAVPAEFVAATRVSLAAPVIALAAADDGGEAQWSLAALLGALERAGAADARALVWHDGATPRVHADGRVVHVSCARAEAARSLAEADARTASALLVFVAPADLMPLDAAARVLAHAGMPRTRWTPVVAAWAAQADLVTEHVSPACADALVRATLGRF